MTTISDEELLRLERELEQILHARSYGVDALTDWIRRTWACCTCDRVTLTDSFHRMRPVLCAALVALLQFGSSQSQSIPDAVVAWLLQEMLPLLVPGPQHHDDLINLILRIRDGSTQK